MRSSWAALAVALGAGPRGGAAWVLQVPGSEIGVYEYNGVVWANASSFPCSSPSGIRQDVTGR